MTTVHKRNPKLPSASICVIGSSWYPPTITLTDDSKKVTCISCKEMEEK